MGLATGDKYGSYEVLELIGAGGMGEVHRVRDTVLHREVALKVLPEARQLDAERLTRFEREARLLASLNHPNIATLHGLESIGDVRALVMELVDGETLEQRLACAGRGLPLGETLQISLQIAAALDAAHERGIVHRDLKPANIKIRSDGTVKVLDFGIAKAYEAGVTGDQGATVTADTHVGGRIIGTPSYMSPEQARGQPVDKRADVWAFGCVLYEMLTGERAFAGDQPPEVIARIIERDPPFELLPAETPQGIRRLLRRCLSKDPRQRLRDMGDARLEIAEAVQASATPGGGDKMVGNQARFRPWVAATALAAVACALLATVLLQDVLQGAEPRVVTRFAVVIPSGQVTQSGAYASVAISPAATHIAYITTDGIHLRAMHESTPRLVEGTEGQDALGVLFSPDGKWLAFYSDQHREIRKVPLAGGTPIGVTTAQGFLGGSWAEDDHIVFAQTTGIFTVSAAGGTPSLLVPADTDHGELTQNPVMLPGERGVVFTVATTAGTVGGVTKKSIVFQPAASTARRVLIEDGADARYVPTGHLVYRNAGTLMAVPFDLASVKTMGTPVPVVTAVGGQPVHDSADFAVSRDGSLVYRTGDAPIRTLMWLYRDGRQEDAGLPPDTYFYARVSPDGSKIATSMNADPDREIHVWDIGARTLARLTFNRELDFQPVWAVDSRSVLFASVVRGQRVISRKAADGSGAAQPLFVASAEFGNANPNSLSPDGTRLLFRRISPEIHNDLWLLPLDGTGAPAPLLATEHDELNGEISPDGRWVAYQSDESGSFEVYIRPFPAVDAGRWQVSRGGGMQPAWSPDGRELFYLAAGRLMGVRIQGRVTPSIDIPRTMSPPLTYTPFTGSGRTYDISPDGQRFLMLHTPTSVTNDPFAGLRRFEIVLNWAEELKAVR